MKIKDVTGRFWNAENNCWTIAESVATEYDGPKDVPPSIDGLDWDYENYSYYYEDDLEAMANLVP